MLEQAIKNRDEAKSKMAGHKIGSKKWIAAEDDLNFWQGKVANFEAMAKFKK